VVSQTFASWNRITDYLRRLDGNSSLFPTALESPRGFTREPKSLLRSKYLDHHGAYPGLGCAAR